ncbi:cryptic loci regulator [Tasmannia lanceolata]|uniref:cryptic loci regulator n=1 Tax=Tasmannia lanceolata TaxID=3420 RepID=UPI004063639B
MADSWSHEWEIINDNGFVYKRRKIQDDSSSVTVPVVVPLPDPEAEAKLQRVRKKKILMKLKDRYRREIEQWEILSSSLRIMNDKTQKSSVLESPLKSIQLPERICSPLIDELLMQAEVQEAILGDLSNLCDTAEAICKDQEDCWKQALIDLPVWATPRALMASLSESENGEHNSNDTDNA